jgi:hypothetical protein
MRASRAYAAVAVNRVLLEPLTQRRHGHDLVVGLDIGKFEILAVPRWADGAFAPPGRVQNPQEIPCLLGLLVPLAQGRRLRVALEPSGTYGDALRQALHDAALPVLRVARTQP